MVGRQRGGLVLARHLPVLVALFLSTVSTLAAAQAATADTAATTQPVTVEALAARIAPSGHPPLPDVETPLFFVPIYIGQELRIYTVTVGWLEYETLTAEASFPHWVAASRAQLMVDYVFFTQRGNRPPPRALMPEDRRPEYEVTDAETHFRITRIADEGNYHERWKAFAPRFWAFYDEMAERVRTFRAQHPDAHLWGDEDPLKLAELAKKHAIHEFIADSSIRPEHVAQEMFRRLEFMRAQHGADDGAERPLVYTCGSGSGVAVLMNPKHPLAPRLANAYVKRDANPQAAAVIGELKRAQATLRAFAEQHPEATTKRLNEEAMRIAASENGLIAQLTAYSE